MHLQSVGTAEFRIELWGCWSSSSEFEAFSSIDLAFIELRVRGLVLICGHDAKSQLLRGAAFMFRARPGRTQVTTGSYSMVV